MRSNISSKEKRRWPSVDCATMRETNFLCQRAGGPEEEEESASTHRNEIRYPQVKNQRGALTYEQEVSQLVRAENSAEDVVELAMQFAGRAGQHIQVRRLRKTPRIALLRPTHACIHTYIHTHYMSPLQLYAMALPVQQHGPRLPQVHQKEISMAIRELRAQHRGRPGGPGGGPGGHSVQTLRVSALRIRHFFGDGHEVVHRRHT